jgi:hypothetical protein
MNIKRTMGVMLTLLALCNGSVSAGALEDVNAEVQNQAVQMDIEYGVLLTGHERKDLQLSLIAKKVCKASNDTVAVKLQTAITTYAVTDPAEQRQLLTLIVSTEDDGGGIRPPK